MLIILRGAATALPLAGNAKGHNWADAGALVRDRAGGVAQRRWEIGGR